MREPPPNRTGQQKVAPGFGRHRPHRSTRLFLIAALSLTLPSPGRANGPAPARVAAPGPQRLRVEVLATYPHDPKAFTQGLLLHGGKLYESTGLYGESSLREVELASGRVLRRVDLPHELFGEGLALVGDRLLQLTWKEGKGLLYDLSSFARAGEHRYGEEGWGLCFDGTDLVMSDGSHRLYFRNPADFAVLRRIAVTESGRPLARLNELECVGEEIYANVWSTDRIVKIHKRNGLVAAVVDASALLSPTERTAAGPGAILNGIAHDPSTGTFLLTGKLWPKVFRVRLLANPRDGG